jgi:Fe-S-cluster formation regulator IscX/YfhJ
MKIRIVGAELSHADGRTDGRTDRRTDMAKLVISLSNFENAPKNEILGAGLMQVTCTFLS